MRFQDALTGEVIADIEAGEKIKSRFGNYYALAHRADVHKAVLDGCLNLPSVELRTSSSVEEYEESEGGVAIKLQSGEKISASALIGADGIRSSVRRQLIGDGEPTSAGAVIYRAVIPVELMPKSAQHAFPVMWGGEGFHLIYYPVRDWTMFNFGLTVMTDDPKLTETSTVGPSELDSLADLMCDEPLSVMKVPASFTRMHIWHRRPVENWTQGKVTLLGDAAHAMVQYLAQGAAQALEDAFCLANKVEESPLDLSTAFLAYQKARLVKAARVQMSALAMERILHAKGLERAVRNSLFKGRTVNEHYDRLAWLYEAAEGSESTAAVT